ncbi:hypothetical protein C8Q75DRAFT_184907 [Abortiporus biennis]|nr:hypothetical protein C8Q75DRAFT_184907 [Abortiporus biennis]
MCLVDIGPFSPSLASSQLPQCYPQARFDGGILGRLIAPGTLEFYSPPCRVRNIPTKKWQAKVDPNSEAFYTDPYQDLLVTISTDGDTTYARFLTMSCGHRHPLSASSHTLNLACKDGLPVACRILGPYIATVSNWASGELVYCRVGLWDWTTGSEIMIYEAHMNLNVDAEIHFLQYTSLVFLDRQHLILTARILNRNFTCQNASLHIVNIARGHAAFKEPFSLGLPEVSSSTEISHLSIVRNAPSPFKTKSSLVGHPNFEASQDSAIVVIPFEVLNCKTDEYQVYDIFVPTEKLLLLVNAARRQSSFPTNVSWDAWGTTNSRAMSGFFAADWTVFGSRHIYVDDEYVCFFDFNYRGALADPYLPDSSCDIEGIHGSRIGRDEPTTIESGLLKKELTTSLPYRFYCTGIENNYCDRVMLSEDVIVIDEEGQKQFTIMGF